MKAGGSERKNVDGEGKRQVYSGMQQPKRPRQGTLHLGRIHVVARARENLRQDGTIRFWEGRPCWANFDLVHTKAEKLGKLGHA